MTYQRPRHSTASLPLVLATCLWGALVIGGSVSMIGYSARPAQDADAPLHWPDATTLMRCESGPTALLFVHPKCPCTRATFAEFERALARARVPFAATIVFVAPPGTDADWHEDHLWTSAQRLEGVTSIVDRDAEEAMRFGAATSGHLLLYDARGGLVFSGGITASRGHEGDSTGRQQFEHLLLGMSIQVPRTSVYGCPLLGPESADADAPCCATQEAKPTCAQ